MAMDALSRHNAGPVMAARMAGHPRVYGILHFGLNTFTNREWGYGDESPALFDPTEFDADQIAAGCRDGGLEGLVIVCKHHDGFCLWPTATTAHNITASPWRGGRGDLVGELVEACRRAGLRVGFYISPWDRNSAFYGTPAYLELFRNQIREVLTRYGEAFEVWFDGANGGDGFYGGARETRKIDHATYYDWPETWQLVRDLQPGAAIFSDVGPDLRWVGNERGFADADASCRYTPVTREGRFCAAPGMIDSRPAPLGDPDGRFWLPPECDVPLRPGWFFHAEENDRLRSTAQLVDIYCRSVGHGGFLNLGLAPDRRGLLHENDVTRLREFKQAVDQLFAVPKVHEFNLIRLREGEGVEKVRGYEVLADNRVVAAGKIIGRERLIRLPETVRAAEVRLHTGNGCPAVLETYLAPSELLKEPRAEDELRSRGNFQEFHPEIAGGGFRLDLGEAARPYFGFAFFPDENLPPGTPDGYRLECSDDGHVWREVCAGEFSNLRANPVPQVVSFAETAARHWRFTAPRMLVAGPALHCAGFGMFIWPLGNT